MQPVYLIVCDVNQIGNVMKQVQGDKNMNMTAVSLSDENVGRLQSRADTSTTAEVARHINEKKVSQDAQPAPVPNAVEQTPPQSSPEVQGTTEVKKRGRKPRADKTTQAPEDEQKQTPNVSTVVPMQPRAENSDDLFSDVNTQGAVDASLTASETQAPAVEEDLFAPPAPPMAQAAMSQEEFSDKIRQIFTKYKDYGSSKALADIFKRHELSRIDSVPADKRNLVVEQFQYVMEGLSSAAQKQQ